MKDQALKGISEYDDKNCLSYLYAEKKHKALAYREIGDKRLEHMQGFFAGASGQVDKELKNIDSEAYAKNQRFDEE